MQKTVFSSSRPIASPGNELVRRLRAFGRRREPGRVLIEGPKLVREAIACGLGLELVALREGTQLDFSAPADEVVTLSERAFAAAAQTVTPQGVLAIARIEQATVAAALAAAGAQRWPLLVLDAVSDPGNVGAICRSLAAAGAPALLLLDASADALSPKAVRASAGAVFRLLLARGSWDDLEGCSGFGLEPRGGADPRTVDLGQAQLLVLGSEAHGLRRGHLDPLTIPMAGGVESLNVAAAAALVVFEVSRGRKP
ncbi:MAG TPA: TrmH family RNA methyltransferase [Candidatus Nitrosotalea sp.]|nr:TrmH family RNA methyltransferase [Candidatus Nitrosotalea sp.]